MFRFKKYLVLTNFVQKKLDPKQFWVQNYIIYIKNDMVKKKNSIKKNVWFDKLLALKIFRIKKNLGPKNGLLIQTYLG